MAGKKASSKNDGAITRAELKKELAEFKAELKPELKSDMVNYIGPIFEDLKVSLKDNLKSIKREIIHEVKVLLDNDERLKALSDLAKIGTDNSSKIENHEGRLTRVEKDVQILKPTKSP